MYRSPEPDIEIPDVTLADHVIGGAALALLAMFAGMAALALGRRE